MSVNFNFNFDAQALPACSTCSVYAESTVSSASSVQSSMSVESAAESVAKPAAKSAVSDDEMEVAGILANLSEFVTLERVEDPFEMDWMLLDSVPDLSVKWTVEEDAEFMAFIRRTC